MTIWRSILEAIQRVIDTGSFSSIFSKRPERSVAFTIAVIALSAKMAKADGHVDVSEIHAFREIFFVAPEDERSVARVYNLARTDTVGFEVYARQIARMFQDTPVILEDLLEGLFHIAASDGELHPFELDFLKTVTSIFGLPSSTFERLRAQHDTNVERNPYLVLNVDVDATDAQVRRAWRDLLYESHPDRLLARGVPAEAIALANHRTRIVNEAYAEITSHRAELSMASV